MNGDKVIVVAFKWAIFNSIVHLELKYIFGAFLQHMNLHISYFCEDFERLRVFRMDLNGKMC